ncbi:MAG: hypothetical protein FWF81_13910 [Defluviitaleaceae bacterium]|nr:hypothetical protein [Defluviitaleaceae bacterium]
MTQLMDRYNSLTSIDNKKVLQLKAVNNVINIVWDIPYKFSHSDEFFTYIIFRSKTDWSNLFAEIYREIGAEGDFFGHDIFKKNENAFAILSKLAGGIGMFINCMYCRTEIIDTLNAVGINPGWVELNNGEHTSRFYFTECGRIVSEEQSNKSRKHLNTLDHRERGLQPGDKIMVNFEYYTVGSDGRIYVPHGVPIIWNTTFWLPQHSESLGWRQDENGSWYREEDNRPFESILDFERRDQATKAFRYEDMLRRYSRISGNNTLSENLFSLSNAFEDVLTFLTNYSPGDTRSQRAFLENGFRNRAIIAFSKHYESPEEVQKQADEFSNAFFRHFDEHGSDAFNLAFGA